MIITKYELKILKYIHHKRTISYKKLSKKMSGNPDFSETLEALVCHQYLVQVGGSHNIYGEPIPFAPDTMFTLAPLGTAEVESHQWFDTEYVISHVIIPVILAVISTLITLFLSNVL